jgi:hypothetical protein
MNRTRQRINTRDVISAKQIERIERLSADLGYGAHHGAHALCLQLMGASLPSLSRAEARDYIARLESEVEEQKRDAHG